MKARLFSGINPVVKEFFLEVEEDADDGVEVNLVDSSGAFIQHICQFTAEGLVLHSLNVGIVFPFDTVQYNGNRRIKTI